MNGVTWICVGDDARQKLAREKEREREREGGGEKHARHLYERTRRNSRCGSRGSSSSYSYLFYFRSEKIKYCIMYRPIPPDDIRGYRNNSATSDASKRWIDRVAVRQSPRKRLVVPFSPRQVFRVAIRIDSIEKKRRTTRRWKEKVIERNGRG